MENLLITGVTGILGRHVLYELLAEYASGIRRGRLFLVVRSNAKESASERISSLLTNPFKPAYLDIYPVEELLSFIELIDSDLRDLKKSPLLKSKLGDYLHVIHIAAITNLNTADSALQDVHDFNYATTLELLEQLKNIPHKFIFISSAFSCGIQTGLIDSNYRRFRQNGELLPFSSLSPYRNHYEFYKAMAEYQVIKHCEANQIAWQILRPAVICGRLLDEPLYYLPLFNVFYEVGRIINKGLQRYKEHDLKKIRIMGDNKSTLNIVPVDYVAKTILAVFRNDEVKQLSIVNSAPLSNAYLIKHSIHKLGLECKLVDSVPDNMNLLEEWYYKRAGKWLSRYLNTTSYNFDAAPLRKLIPHIPEPDIQNTFEELYDYALQHNFENPELLLSTSAL